MTEHIQPASNEDGDEWEFINDDGFVYKCRKRNREGNPIASGSAYPDRDLQAEIKQRKSLEKRQRVKKLKDEYLREISQWEHLSNTLREMDDRISNNHQSQQQEDASSSSGVLDERVSSVCCPLIDELLLQVGAQEATIQDFSNLCDTAVAICEAEEEQLNQPLFEHPIWGTPRSLMASLSDQDYCNNSNNNDHAKTNTLDSVETAFGPNDFLKVYGCRSQDRKAYGGIFRLPNGIPIVAFNRRVLGEEEDIGVIESKAICEGLMIAEILGFKSLCTQSDSEYAAKNLNEEYKSPWACITELRDAKRIINKMDSSLILSIRREGNKAS
ncbi:hypothetical protein GIB67_004430 [Kingdonia uniflora]|uniref:RNase H type-1 domain-containing protein n=1 Tax=Kingdonia uniflora TaxID=39325 RepID=A0A7J7MRS1_9MAGN|nr:hypothetical protein GIB67_004430 [Kingdonia uniflora]